MKKALFLDRDGVINIEKDYLYKKEDFKFIDGIFELCRYYMKHGYLIFIVTNQSGIARGYYGEEDFELLTNWMLEEFLKQDVMISKVYHCPHHPDITGSCACRKPKPKMLLDAQREYDLDLKNSIIVGDKQRDIDAGFNAGVSTAYLFDETGTKVKSNATKIVNKLGDIYNVNSK